MERAESNGTRRARVAETAKEASRRRHMQRRSTSIMGGAAPDTIIGPSYAGSRGSASLRATGTKARPNVHRPLVCETVSLICNFATDEWRCANNRKFLRLSHLRNLRFTSYLRFFGLRAAR